MVDAGLIFISDIVTALSYTYFLSSNLPKGIYRFISLLPIFFLFTILPLLLSSAVATVVATIFITWLANFKPLLFAFDHGPLFPPKSLIHFITITSFPVLIEPHFFNPRKKSHLYLWTELFVSPFMINFVYNHKHEWSPNALLIVYIVGLFILLDLMVLASNAVVGLVVGLEPDQPPSDEPYLATSVQDFWGRRWNLMVTNSLRHTVYKPVRSVFPGTAAPAVMATFVVSGLMHELMLYYVTRASPTWDMTWFFVVHGMCLVVEIKVKRAVAGKFELPTMVSRVLTTGFLLSTGPGLFFPALTKGGADVKVLEELKLFVNYGKSLFGLETS